MGFDTTSLLGEKLLNLYEAARRLPHGRRNRPVSFSCLLRWITDGVPGPDGNRVRLEGVRLGGRWLTSEEAIARFAARLTPQFDAPAAPVPRTASQRRRESERAAAELERRGI